MCIRDRYWDKDNVHLDKVTLAFYDGSDQESIERNFTSGAYSYARLFPTSSNYSKVAESYKDNIFYTPSGPGIAGSVSYTHLDVYKRQQSQ